MQGNIRSQRSGYRESFLFPHVGKRQSPRACGCIEVRSRSQAA